MRLCNEQRSPQKAAGQCRLSHTGHHLEGLPAYLTSSDCWGLFVASSIPHNIISGALARTLPRLFWLALLPLRFGRGLLGAVPPLSCLTHRRFWGGGGGVRGGLPGPGGRLGPAEVEELGRVDPDLA